MNPRMFLLFFLVLLALQDVTFVQAAPRSLLLVQGGSLHQLGDIVTLKVHLPLGLKRSKILLVSGNASTELFPRTPPWVSIGGTSPHYMTLLINTSELKLGIYEIIMLNGKNKVGEAELVLDSLNVRVIPLGVLLPGRVKLRMETLSELTGRPLRSNVTLVLRNYNVTVSSGGEVTLDLNLSSGSYEVLLIARSNALRVVEKLNLTVASSPVIMTKKIITPETKAHALVFWIEEPRLELVTPMNTTKKLNLTRINSTCWRADLELPQPIPLGEYLLRAYTSNTSSNVTFTVTSLNITFLPSNRTFLVSDVLTGAPVNGTLELNATLANETVVTETVRLVGGKATVEISPSELANMSVLAKDLRGISVLQEFSSPLVFLETDKEIYSPGEVVIITGRGLRNISLITPSNRTIELNVTKGGRMERTIYPLYSGVELGTYEVLGFYSGGVVKATFEVSMIDVSCAYKCNTTCLLRITAHDALSEIPINGTVTLEIANKTLNSSLINGVAVLQLPAEEFEGRMSVLDSRGLKREVSIHVNPETWVFPDRLVYLAGDRVRLQVKVPTSGSLVLLSLKNETILSKNLKPGRTDLFVHTRDLAPGIYTVLLKTNSTVERCELTLVKLTVDVQAPHTIMAGNALQVRGKVLWNGHPTDAKILYFFDGRNGTAKTVNGQFSLDLGSPSVGGHKLEVIAEVRGVRASNSTFVNVLSSKNLRIKVESGTLVSVGEIVVKNRTSRWMPSSGFEVKIRIGGNEKRTLSPLEAWSANLSQEMARRLTSKPSRSLRAIPVKQGLSQVKLPGEVSISVDLRNISSGTQLWVLDHGVWKRRPAKISGGKLVIKAIDGLINDADGRINEEIDIKFALGQTPPGFKVMGRAWIRSDRGKLKVLSGNSYEVTGLKPGEEVDVEIILPVPAAEWVKVGKKKGNKLLSPPCTVLDNYTIVLHIRDNGPFDDDPRPGIVRDPVVYVYTVTTTSWTGAGSLGSALDSAGTDGGVSIINFNIPVTDSGFNGKWWTITATAPVVLQDDGYPTIIDGASQTINVGDTNPGNLGTGGPVGVGADGIPNSGDEATLPLYSKPEVELYIRSSLFSFRPYHGFYIFGPCVIKNMSITGSLLYYFFLDRAIFLIFFNETAENSSIYGSYIGVEPDGTPPQLHNVASRNPRSALIAIAYTNSVAINSSYVGYSGCSLVVGGGNNLTLERSEFFSPSYYTRANALEIFIGSDVTIRYNLVRDCPATTSYLYSGAVELWGTSFNNSKFVNNTVVNSQGYGLLLDWGTFAINVTNNLFYDDLLGVAVSNWRNVTAGVPVTFDVILSKNSFYNNTRLGIDLINDTTGTYKGDNATLNDGVLDPLLPNNGTDYPVIRWAVYDGQALYVEGFINQENATSGSPSFSGAIVELFLVNNSVMRDNLTGNNYVLNTPVSNYYGEGLIYIGSLRADANGEFAGWIKPPSASKLGVKDLITGTTTLPGLGTSEFGPDVRIIPRRLNITMRKAIKWSGAPCAFNVTLNITNLNPYPVNVSFYDVVPPSFAMYNVTDAPDGNSSSSYGVVYNWTRVIPGNGSYIVSYNLTYLSCGLTNGNLSDSVIVGIDPKGSVVRSEFPAVVFLLMLIYSVISRRKRRVAIITLAFLLLMLPKPVSAQPYLKITATEYAAIVFNPDGSYHVSDLWGFLTISNPTSDTISDIYIRMNAPGYHFYEIYPSKGPAAPPLHIEQLPPGSYVTWRYTAPPQQALVPIRFWESISNSTCGSGTAMLKLMVEATSRVDGLRIEKLLPSGWAPHRITWDVGTLMPGERRTLRVYISTRISRGCVDLSPALVTFTTGGASVLTKITGISGTGPAEVSVLKNVSKGYCVGASFRDISNSLVYRIERICVMRGGPNGKVVFCETPGVLLAPGELYETKMYVDNTSSNGVPIYYANATFTIVPSFSGTTIPISRLGTGIYYVTANLNEVRACCYARNVTAPAKITAPNITAVQIKVTNRSVISLSKSADRYLVLPGDQVKFDIFISNDGNRNVNLTVIDTMSKDLSFVRIVRGPAPSSEGKNRLSWTLKMAPNSSVHLAYLVSVSSTPSETHLDNYASAGNASAHVRLALSLGEATIYKTASLQGFNLVYRIMVHSVSYRGKMTVRDYLPPGVSYVPGSSKVNSTRLEPLISGSTLSWRLVMRPNTSKTITFKIRVNKMNLSLKNVAQIVELNKSAQFVIDLRATLFFSGASLVLAPLFALFLTLRSRREKVFLDKRSFLDLYKSGALHKLLESRDVILTDLTLMRILREEPDVILPFLDKISVVKADPSTARLALMISSNEDELEENLARIMAAKMKAKLFSDELEGRR